MACNPPARPASARPPFSGRNVRTRKKLLSLARSEAERALNSRMSVSGPCDYSAPAPIGQASRMRNAPVSGESVTRGLRLAVVHVAGFSGGAELERHPLAGCWRRWRHDDPHRFRSSRTGGNTALPAPFRLSREAVRGIRLIIGRMPALVAITTKKVVRFPGHRALGCSGEHQVATVAFHPRPGSQVQVRGGTALHPREAQTRRFWRCTDHEGQRVPVGRSFVRLSRFDAVHAVAFIQT